MLQKVFRNFTYRPTKKLEFIQRKCNLITQNSLYQVNVLSYVGIAIVGIGSISTFGLSSSFILPLAVYGSYALNFHMLSNYTIGKLELHDDGKQLTLTNCLGKVTGIQISDIVPSTTEINLKTLKTELTLKDKKKFIILNASEFPHLDVLTEVLKGKEIIIE